MWSTRVTRADVAARAAVSGTTVSFVLNRTPGQRIPEETRERVLRAAAELGYTPHLGAQSMRRGSSDLIVLLSPPLRGGHALADFTEALIAEASHRGHACVLLNTSTEIRMLLRTIRLLSPSAIASIADIPQEVLAMAAEAKIPVSIAEHLVGSPAGAQTRYTHNRETLGYQQVQYLRNQGHSRIAYLLPDDASLSSWSARRTAGARAAQRELGLPPLRIGRAPIARKRLEGLATRWVRDGVTAVCAYNDDWALPLLGAMHGIGLRAPDDLAVIGLDDVPAAEFSVPPLTTIRQYMAPIAQGVLAELDAVLGREARWPDSETRYSDIVPRKSA